MIFKARVEFRDVPGVEIEPTWRHGSAYITVRVVAGAKAGDVYQGCTLVAFWDDHAKRVKATVNAPAEIREVVPELNSLFGYDTGVIEKHRRS